MHAQPFGVTICDRTIRVYGDVDMAVTEQLVDAIRCCAQSVDDRTVALDLTNLTFLDSTGINALIRSHQDLAGMGKELVLHGIPERVRRTLTVAGVVDHLNVRSTPA